MTPIRTLFAALSLLAAGSFTGADAKSLANPAAHVAAAAERRLDTCSWERPGVDPFMGDVVAAVDRYQDIAPETRARLKARMAKRDYDEIVSIERDAIKGKGTYGTTIRDMHFGTGQVCHNVTRASWRPETKERGLVYCEGRECILVPTVCRNVSRVARAQVMNAAAGDPEGGLLPDTVVALGPVPPVGAAPDTDLVPGTGLTPLAGDAPGGFAEQPSFVALGGVPGATPTGSPFGGAPGAGPGGYDGGEPDGTPATPGSTVPGGPYGPSPSPVPVPPDFFPRMPDGSGLVPVRAVPEPSTWLLLAAGCAVLALTRRSRQAAPRRAA